MKPPAASVILAIAFVIFAAPFVARRTRADMPSFSSPAGSVIGNAMVDTGALYSVAQLPRDAAALVSDVTIQDGTVLTPGQSFTKTWRVENNGSTSWSGYSLAFFFGDQMGAPASVPVPINPPGGIVDISVPMTAPTEAGSHRGDWQMRTADGRLFAESVFVLITVKGTRTFAEWETDLGDRSPFVRQTAVKAFRDFGPRAVPTLTKVMKNDVDATVRLNAMAALADMSPPMPAEALRAILAAISDRDSAVSTAAMMILLASPPKYDPEAVPTLVDALKDSSSEVRMMAARLLAVLGPAAKAGIPALSELATRDPDEHVQDAAKGALQAIESH